MTPQKLRNQQKKRKKEIKKVAPVLTELDIIAMDMDENDWQHFLRDARQRMEANKK